MSYTIEQQPSGYWGAYDKVTYRVYDDTNVGDAKYRYVAKIFWKTQVIATIKVLPNNNDRGIFEISRILQDQLIEDLPFNIDAPLTAANMSGDMAVQFYYESAPDADSAPTESALQVTSQTLRVLAGSFTLRTQNSNQTTTGNFAFNTVSPYLALSNYPSKFSNSTSNVPPTLMQRVRSKDYATMTVMRQNTLQFELRFLTDSYVQIGSATIWNYTTQIATGDNALHIPAGLQNFADMGISIPAGTAYYVIEYSPSIQRQMQWFKIEDGCKYEAVRFAWWNKYGGIDYINFYGASKESSKVQRHTYRTYGGNFFTAGTDANDNAVILASDGVRSAGRTEVETTKTANSGYITEDEVPAVMDLVQSPRVWVFQSDAWQAVMIDENQVTKQTSLIDKTINYTIRFTFAKYANSVG
jgi:hypothetical protein